MREASYQDREGRWYAVLLPEDAPDDEAYRGLPLGPPPLDVLGLPHDLEIRLNNELFWRRVFTEADARARPGDIASAIISACRLDAMRIADCYTAPSLDALPPAIVATEDAQPSE